MRSEGEKRKEAIALLHHHISPAIGWWRMADSQGEAFDISKLDDRFERAADAVIDLLREEDSA